MKNRAEDQTKQPRNKYNLSYKIYWKVKKKLLTTIFFFYVCECLDQLTPQLISRDNCLNLHHSVIKKLIRINILS